MRRKYILIIFLLFCSMGVKAQAVASLNQLTATNWIDEDGSFYVKFNNYTMFTYYIGENGFAPVGTKDSYHLGFKSNVQKTPTGETFSMVFVPEHCGVKANGTYIITTEMAFVINEISSTALTLTPMTFGGQPIKLKPFKGSLPAGFPE